MNKILILVFISLLLNASHLKSQNDETMAPDSLGAISLIKCPDEVLRYDTVKVVIENESQQVLYYSVALEEKIGGVWIEIADDIFFCKYDKRKTRNVRILLPEEQKIIEWNIPEYLTKLPQPQGLCRFRINYGNSPFNQKRQIYSDEFLIF